MKLTIRIFFIAITLQFFSCKKEIPAVNTDEQLYDTCLLLSKIENGNNIIKLEYDSTDKIYKVNDKIIEYNTQGFIKECEFSIDALTTYKSNGQIYSRRFPTGGPAHTTVYYTYYYKYNITGQLIQIIHHHWEDPDEITGYDTFYYENNNIIREEYYSGDPDGNKKLLSAREYTYDDKINPTYTYDKFLGPASYNNVISTKSFWNGNFSGSVSSKFTYNASGYPLREEVVFHNGNKDEISYQYSCK